MLDFETNRWLYRCLLPLYWLLTLWVMAKKGLWRMLGKPAGPAINTLWFDGLGRQLRRIKEGSTSWKALDVIYHHRFGACRTLGGRIDDFWIGMLNAQAVRNRLKLARREIRQALLAHQSEPEIRMISLACGSAEAALDVIGRLKREGILVRALLVDIDPSALAYARCLATRFGVEDRVTIVRTNAFRIARLAKRFKPHLVEMLGLLDYLSQDQAVWLARQIKEDLVAGGRFLTCNIAPNPERHFLKWVINWPMIYRTPRQLADVVIQAGFAEHRLLYEPLKVHGIVIARK